MNINTRGTRSIVVPMIVMTGAYACDGPEAGNRGSQSVETKTEIVATSAKPVQAAMRWGQAITAKVAKAVGGSSATAQLGVQYDALLEGDNDLGDGSLYDEWLYAASAGEELEVLLRSDDFDTYLMVTKDYGGYDLLAEDDDSGGGLNAMVTVRFPESGVYAIIANSYGPGETGSYELILRRPSGSEGGVPVIRSGSTVQSVLRGIDPSLDDGTHYREWYYHGSAGERVTVNMTSSDFDTFLGFGRGRVGSSFEELRSDNDGGTATDSRVSLTLPEDGTYSIVANSYDVAGGLFGAFELTVDSRAPISWREVYQGDGDPSERYALLVGIDDYPGDNNDLQGPTGDVAMMHEMLVGTYGFPEENIVTLLDADATRDHITQAFSRHLGQAGPEGGAVFFFSGHGSRLSENRGVIDYEENGVDEALIAWANEDGEDLILDDELGFLADGLGTSTTLLIIDACFSGTASRAGESVSAIQPKEIVLDEFVNLRNQWKIAGNPNSTFGTSGSEAVGGALDRVRNPERHVLLAASSEDELAWTTGMMPGRDEPVSTFTYYLYQTVAERGPSATFEEIHADLVMRIADHQAVNDLAPQTPQVAGQARSQTITSFLQGR